MVSNVAVLTDCCVNCRQMVLVYPTDNMDLSRTMALSIIGSAFNLFIFSILVLVAVLSQVALETFPDTGSRIVFAAGIAAVLDPLLVLIVDCATFTWTGDAFMLFNYFEKEVPHSQRLKAISMKARTVVIDHGR